MSGRQANERQGRSHDLAAQANQPPEHTGAGAFLGGVLGGILGWLIGVGALPHPAFLPLDGSKPLILTLVLAGGGAVIGGLTGALADSSAAAVEPDAATTTSIEIKAQADAGHENREDGHPS